MTSSCCSTIVLSWCNSCVRGWSAVHFESGAVACNLIGLRTATLLLSLQLDLWWAVSFKADLPPGLRPRRRWPFKGGEVPSQTPGSTCGHVWWRDRQE
eukprot:487338-Pyramimonas_sp.AAC.1